MHSRPIDFINDAEILAALHAQCFPKGWNAKTFADFAPTAQGLLLSINSTESEHSRTTDTNHPSYPKNFWTPACAGDSLGERIHSERIPCEGRGPVLSGFKGGWYDVGFIIYTIAADQADLVTLGIIPQSQQHGAGRFLIEQAFVHLKSLGVEKLFLEVAIDNAAALALYTRTGFVQVGTRPQYYTRTTGASTDAAVLLKTI
jgi:ribosomal protein S18 acetylase RimI-like enzyme